jgi:putative ABC transport system permease protein
LRNIVRNKGFALLTVWLMEQWLNDFAYHTTIPLWAVFATAGMILLIALTTSSYQALKAAFQNPVDNLRQK